MALFKGSDCYQKSLGDWTSEGRDTTFPWGCADPVCRGKRSVQVTGAVRTVLCGGEGWGFQAGEGSVRRASQLAWKARWGLGLRGK